MSEEQQSVLGKALLEAVAAGRIHHKGRGRSHIRGVSIFVPVAPDGNIDLPRFRMYAQKKLAETTLLKIQQSTGVPKPHPTKNPT